MVRSSGKPPSIDAQSFNCPHCGMASHQSWLNLIASYNEKNAPPKVIFDLTADFVSLATNQPSGDVQSGPRSRYHKLNSGLPFIELIKDKLLQNKSSTQCVVYNINLSQCYSCKQLAVWLHSRLIYPPITLATEASPDMPADIKIDFEEARQIFPSSPRGAAALLRLSIQKLCVELGEKGNNIDDDIASLVQKGLSTKVQQALDIVRVIGNEAVHPGQINLNDDPGIAQALFELVNVIVDEMISEPKKIDEIYRKLPPAKLDAIKRRDTQKKSGK